jgi:hypothetical protein
MHNPDRRKTGDINSRRPIIPHDTLGANCGGCLYVRVTGLRALSSATSAVEKPIRAVPVEEIEEVMR